MNKIDRQWYKHLKALSKISIQESYDKFKTENIKKFGKYMQGETCNQLHKLGYITLSPSVNQILNPSGLEQLRMLEDMRRKDLTLISSIIAIVISLVALSKSMGWI